jgi:cytochrome c oxidase subunit 2
MKLFDFPLFPEAASTLAKDVDALYFFSLAISAFFSLLIAVIVFVLFVKYRRKHTGEVGEDVHGSVAVELAWSAIPLVISMILFGWGAKVFLDIVTPPENARVYYATGKQWMWKIQHPEGQREINQLHIPVGQPIKMMMTTEDVIHSFYIPAFRVKADVIPGRYTSIWFEATKPGTYHLFCAEYCGAEHSKMIGQVIVMEREEYQVWLAGGPALPPVVAGEQLFEQYACNTCHMPDATGRGPWLEGIAGEDVRLVGGGQVTRDDNYLRESILNPNAKLVAGYTPLMPTFQGQISEEGVMNLIAYIKSLGAAGAGAAPAEAETSTVADGTTGETAP